MVKNPQSSESLTCSAMLIHLVSIGMSVNSATTAWMFFVVGTSPT